VSVVVSKGGGRYRVQGGCFEALELITLELTKRLKFFFTHSAGAAETDSYGPFSIAVVDPLPLAEYFPLVDAHFDVPPPL
jgi:hypothetical protein